MVIHDIYVLKDSGSFEIKEKEEVTVNLELERVPPCYHTLLRGKVMYRNQPIEGAAILILDSDSNPVASTITDEDGMYRFLNQLRPGNYKLLSSAIGYITSDRKDVLIKQNEIAEQCFELEKSLLFIRGIIYGRILEAGTGKPIENAVITLKSFEDHGNMIYVTKSNCNGQYLFYNILPQCYGLIIRKQGYIVPEIQEIKIDCKERICINIDLYRNHVSHGNTISGRVMVDNAPESEIVVFLYQLEKKNNEKIVQVQMTNKDGFYLFSSVESGSYLVKGKLQNSFIYEQVFTIE